MRVGVIGIALFSSGLAHAGCPEFLAEIKPYQLAYSRAETILQQQVALTAIQIIQKQYPGEACKFRLDAYDKQVLQELSLNPREVPSPLIDKPAPDFTLQELHDPLSRFSNKDMLGKVWILNVWASWCVACRQENPLLVQLSRANIVPIYGLNYKDVPSEAKRWLAEGGDPYIKSVMDYEDDVAIDYGIYGIPESFVIDKQGIIRHKVIGPLTAKELGEVVLPLVKELEGPENIEVVVADAPQETAGDVRESVPETKIKTQPLPPQEELLTTDASERKISAGLNVPQREEQSEQVFVHQPKKKYLSARTKEYRFASYEEAWRAKVERVGNLNFPDEAQRQKLSGSLRLAVTLNADGSVKSINVRQSSGYRVLDAAAIRIVRLAAPYARFPQDIREEFDELVITRTWQFEAGSKLSTR